LLHCESFKIGTFKVFPATGKFSSAPVIGAHKFSQMCFFIGSIGEHMSPDIKLLKLIELS
jgi:hypothetical protein